MNELKEFFDAEVTQAQRRTWMINDMQEALGELERVILIFDATKLNSSSIIDARNIVKLELAKLKLAELKEDTAKKQEDYERVISELS